MASDDEEFQADLQKALAASLEEGPRAYGGSGAYPTLSWRGAGRSSPACNDDDDDALLAAAMEASLRSAAEDEARRRHSGGSSTVSSGGVWGGRHNLLPAPAAAPSSLTARPPSFGSHQHQPSSSAPALLQYEALPVRCASGLLLQPLPSSANATDVRPSGSSLSNPMPPAAASYGGHAPASAPLLPPSPFAAAAALALCGGADALPRPLTGLSGGGGGSGHHHPQPHRGASAPPVGPGPAGLLSSSPAKHGRTPSHAEVVDLAQPLVKRSRPASDTGGGEEPAPSDVGGAADRGGEDSRAAGRHADGTLALYDELYDARTATPPERPASAASGCTASPVACGGTGAESPAWVSSRGAAGAGASTCAPLDLSVPHNGLGATLGSLLRSASGAADAGAAGHKLSLLQGPRAASVAGAAPSTAAAEAGVIVRRWMNEQRQQQQPHVQREPAAAPIAAVPACLHAAAQAPYNGAADRRLHHAQRVFWWAGCGRVELGRVSHIDRRATPLMYGVRLEGSGEHVLATADCLLPYVEHGERVMCRLPPEPAGAVEAADAPCAWACGTFQHCVFDGAEPAASVLLGLGGQLGACVLPYERLVPVADVGEGSSWAAGTAL